MNSECFNRAVLGAALLAVVLHTAAYAQRGARERFEETTSVVVVQVPLQVTVDGEPLKGLTAENFEVIDDRKEQAITGFEAYDLSLTTVQGKELAAMAVPASARRHFLMLFDLSFSNPDSVSRARSAARDLVKESLHPSDLVGVATYSVAGGARLVLGFTPDREQVELAIRTLGLINPAEKVSDPLNLQFAALTDSITSQFRFDEEVGGFTGESGLAGGSNRDQEWYQQVREMSILTGKATRSAQVQQVTALTNSMQDLASILANVPGRKHVLYLSEGFDSSIMLGNAGMTGEEQRRIMEMNAAAEFGVFQEVDSAERFGESAALNAMSDMVEQLRRADCTVQSIDIGGLRAGGDARGGGGSSADSSTAARGEQGLFFLANETGGELYRNFNDLGAAMGEMLERTSNTYVLSFQPDKLAMNGEYRPLKVKLKNVPRNARIVHRPGYYAPKPFSEQTAMERTMLSAGIVMGGAEGGPIGLNVLAAPFRSAGAKAYVPLLIEIDGPGLLAGQTEGAIPAEIYGYAISQDGKIADFFSQAMALDLARVGGALSQSGFKFWGDFELLPGHYLLRVLVRNSSNGDFSLSSTPVHVPEFASEQALLPPFFPEEPGKWLLGREQSSRGQAEYDYPFLRQGNSFIPAAKPEIPAGHPINLCLVGFNFGADLEVEAVLSDLDGQPIGSFPIALQADPSEAGMQRWLGRFKTGSEVAQGSYMLQLVARGGTGGEVLSAAVEVSVRR